ncbi:LuxR family transcriptional regulator [Streptomyces sp. B1I3]|uniref:LuxR family transcriptional regulator n=1 Tax=Streptomyces sp. B1I3 TaxID=3042264 RepID=UPI00277EE4F0|nr:LuxR family transcriptional regulator [Streptomyces sp. B1I3]MDQ0795464.1 hypothetical protein [Streptomyces sp. B1I3]
MTRTTPETGPSAESGEGRRPEGPGGDPLGPPASGPEGPEEGQDAIEQALLQVRALIESTVERHRSRVSWDHQIVAVDGRKERLLDEARKLVLMARSTIDVVLASGPSCGAEARAPLRELTYVVPDTVHMRLLCSPAMIDEDFVREQLDQGTPVEVRVARVPPLQALIVDGTVALVSAESSTGRRASLIKVPDVISTLRTLYEGVWRNAVPAYARITFGDHCRTDLARRILGALRAGVTDEVAARELIVSVRTYRRYVAEIMTLLDASSRFQAGVRAAELGLLGGIEGPGRPPAPLTDGT